MAVLVPISVGEAMDKLTILYIKSERIQDPEKLKNIHNEIAVLEPVCSIEAYQTDKIKHLFSELKQINETLWTIEDDIRDKEAAHRFDNDFIQLARSVYVTNDKRADIKKQINLEAGSDLIEEKSYHDFAPAHAPPQRPKS